MRIRTVPQGEDPGRRGRQRFYPSIFPLGIWKEFLRITQKVAPSRQPTKQQAQPSNPDRKQIGVALGTVRFFSMSSESTPATSLKNLDAKESTGEYLARVWQRRHFASALASSELRSQHLNSVLGQVWHLLNPAMMITVYYFIFGLVLNAKRGIDHYVTYLVLGVVAFRLAQSIIIESANSMSKNHDLIKTIQFPRALIPISGAYQRLLDSLPGFGLAVLISLIEGAPIAWRILLLPIFLFAASLFSLGFGFFVARIGSSFPDLQQILPHVFRILFYISGVLYRPSSSIKNSTMNHIMALNPIHGLLEIVRWTVLGGSIHLASIISFATFLAIGLIGGFFFFKQAEFRYGA